MPGSITRRRTGCSVCRKRRIRCDEAKPSCQNCIRNSQACSWMKDLRFIHERNTGDAQGTASNASKSLNFRKQLTKRNGNQDASGDVVSSNAKQLHRGAPTSFLSAREFENSHIKLSSPKNSTSSHHSEFFTTNARSGGSKSLDHSARNGSDSTSISTSAVTTICRSESARLRDSIEIEHASPIPPNLNPNPEGFTNWATLGVSEELQKALNSDLEVELLNNYIWECAPWFDAHNSKRNFSQLDVPRMMNCPPWRAAALALSAKNIELRNGDITNAESISLHLYQLAVMLAIDSISGRFDCVGTLAGCVLLAVYEMMTVSYTDWRRHLQGCASIYTHNEWNGSSGGLISASFWDYARIDIWAAYCCATDTLIHPDSWFDDPDKIMSLSNVDGDTHTQISTWLLGRTVNLVHRNSKSDACSISPELEQLKQDLFKWEAMGSITCRPVISRDIGPDENIPFPRILFSSYSSIIAHTMFHTGMVLLLEYELCQGVPETFKSSDTIYYHSRMACGIIESNDHTACLVNSLQPMWICGRHLRTEAEKNASLEILVRIEQRTGWKCDWRSRELREFWERF